MKGVKLGKGLVEHKEVKRKKKANTIFKEKLKAKRANTLPCISQSRPAVHLPATTLSGKAGIPAKLQALMEKLYRNPCYHAFALGQEHSYTEVLVFGSCEVPSHPRRFVCVPEPLALLN